MSGFKRPHCLEPSACAAKQPTTHCRRCSLAKNNADPEFAKRRHAGILAKHADPAFAAEHRERLAATMAEVWQRPEYREKLRAHGQRQYREVLNTPEVRARNTSPEVRKEAGRKRTETVLGWCPVELRADYDYLVRTQHIPALEARKLIEERIVGSRAHAVRAVGNEQYKARLKDERDKAQAY